MVKIVGLSEEELKEQKRFSILEEITKRLLPKARVATVSETMLIFIGEEYSLKTYKGTGNNYFVDVHNPKVRRDAIKLAEAYEAAGEPEITVRELY